MPSLIGIIMCSILHSFDGVHGARLASASSEDTQRHRKMNITAASFNTTVLFIRPSGEFLF
jgi:hypothetical protein